MIGFPTPSYLYTVTCCLCLGSRSRGAFPSCSPRSYPLTSLYISRYYFHSCLALIPFLHPPRYLSSPPGLSLSLSLPSLSLLSPLPLSFQSPPPSPLTLSSSFTFSLSCLISLHHLSSSSSLPSLRRTNPTIRDTHVRYRTSTEIRSRLSCQRASVARDRNTLIHGRLCLCLSVSMSLSPCLCLFLSLHASVSLCVSV